MSAMTNLRNNLRRELHISIVDGSAGAVQTNGSGFWAVHVLKPDWIKDAPALPLGWESEDFEGNKRAVAAKAKAFGDPAHPAILDKL
jgi:hypothetical protein